MFLQAGFFSAVHELSPEFVDVVAAMGDSVTVSTQLDKLSRRRGRLDRLDFQPENVGMYMFSTLLATTLKNLLSHHHS